jgi:hypothetical protein
MSAFISLLDSSDEHVSINVDRIFYFKASPKENSCTIIYFDHERWATYQNSASEIITKLAGVGVQAS